MTLATPRSSAKRRQQEVEMYMDMLHAGISLEDRQRANAMWQAQDGEWVELYIRDTVTLNLLHSFMASSTNRAVHDRQVADQRAAFEKRYPQHVHRYILCHE